MWLCALIKKKEKKKKGFQIQYENDENLLKQNLWFELSIMIAFTRQTKHTLRPPILVIHAVFFLFFFNRQ